MEISSARLKNTKPLWPFFIGVASLYFVLRVYGLIPNEYPIFGLLFEYSVLAFSGYYAVRIAKYQQNGIITKILAGCFVGVTLDIIFHPTIGGGFERNLFPVEIAIHMLLASISIIPSVLISQRIMFRNGRDKT